MTKKWHSCKNCNNLDSKMDTAVNKFLDKVDDQFPAESENIILPEWVEEIKKHLSSVSSSNWYFDSFTKKLCEDKDVKGATNYPVEIASFESVKDGEFVAKAKNLIPKLIEEIKKLQIEVDVLNHMIEFKPKNKGEEVVDYINNYDSFNYWKNLD